jgi:gluconokinase
MTAPRYQPVKLKKAERPLVLAIDIGTSSARALVYDARGRPVKRLGHQVRYPMTTTQDGGVYADAPLLARATETCVDRVLDEAGRAATDLRAVGMDTFWHSLLGVDARGEPTIPLINWADTRSRTVIPLLRRELDPREVHQRTGCYLHPSYWPAKILWLSKSDRDAFRRTVRWHSIGEYLLQRFHGKALSSVSMASGTGLFHQNDCTWDERMLSCLPTTLEALPELGDLDTPLQGLRRRYARRWPALAAVPWVPAVGDGASANVGSGCTRDGQLCMTMGTSGAMRILRQVRRIDIPDGLWTYRLDRKRSLLGGALSEGGNVRKWLASQQGVAHGKQWIDAALDATAPDEHQLTVLPVLAGERSPGWHENATGVIAGLNLDITREELTRAVVESMGYRFASIYEIFRAHRVAIREIVASGGAFADSAVMVQLMADILGRPVTQSAEAEGSARGSALLALEAIGAVTDLAALPAPLGPTFEPDPKRHRVYREARTRQAALYDLIAREWWPRR